MTRSYPVDKQLVQRRFGAHAADYDRYAVVQKRVVSRLVESLPGHWLPGRSLEVGTGTGLLATALLERWPTLPLVISDLAHGMTRHARSRLPGVFAADADAAALPFVSGRFSSVFSSSVYQWVDDLPQAFAEVRRVLRPGGLFAFALFGERSLFELRESHRAAVRVATSGRLSHVQEYPSMTEVRQSLQAAGFTRSRLFEEDEIDLHPDVPALLRSLKQIGAGNASASRPGGLASRRVMFEMMDHYRRHYGCGEGIAATYHVLYGSAETSLADEAEISFTGARKGA